MRSTSSKNGIACVLALLLELPAGRVLRPKPDAALPVVARMPTRRVEPAAPPWRARVLDAGPNSTADEPPRAAGRALRPGRSGGALTGVRSGTLLAPEPPPGVERLMVTPPVPAPT